ncbi:hypothetical protein H0O00_00395, partial [Candidatus Micrarchaeota archaeon]|nr:hypothetical protein [Candidatus Micrarchaeota archaeon]
LCSIRESAPISCRHYPFQLNGKLTTRLCPLLSQLAFRVKGPDIKTDQMVRELEAHKKIVAEWNKKPGKKAECIPFLLRECGRL